MAVTAPLERAQVTAQARCIVAFGLSTPDAARLADFYAQAFGCRRGPGGRREGAAFERLMGVAGGAYRQMLTAGNEVIELLQFDHPGAPYPPNPSPAERTFQHFAFVVSDMHRAVLRLESPDGHPLEFLEFPAAQTPARWRQRIGTGEILGIDHSAISVADTARSVAFYRELGFTPTAHTYNQGQAQSALDGIPHPCVAVTALRATEPAPHLELLCYQSDAPRGNGAAAANDAAATRLTIEIERFGARTGEEILLRDPDGHRLHLVPPLAQQLT
jgi:catechol 2,3-dioxygenase-like lactoylglutathione lyase family enzyme